MSNETKKHLRVLQGKVVHVKDKTIAVVVERLEKHEFYGKYIRQKTKYHAHDPNSESRVGDIVEITECRPISKTKSSILTKIVTRAAI